MLIKVPVSWLREYVDIAVPIDELALKLHMASTEVKGVERPWWNDKIRVGRVEKLTKHPNADKLQLATVSYGAGQTKTVVTGATNLTEGAIVPYADEGAEFIDGHTGERTILKAAKMRGVQSEGMVLSAKELGLGEDHEGIQILDPRLPVGALLREVLGETILALELQPNRPDCLGVVGIARETSALLGTGLREPPLERLPEKTPRGLDVRIEDDVACPRFAAALLHDVRIGPSPGWMQARLVAAGMRPIDNVVDITNYVMLELGQPLHAASPGSFRPIWCRWPSPARAGSCASTPARRSPASSTATRGRARASTFACASPTCPASSASRCRRKRPSTSCGGSSSRPRPTATRSWRLRRSSGRTSRSPRTSSRRSAGSLATTGCRCASPTDRCRSPSVTRSRSSGNERATRSSASGSRRSSRTRSSIRRGCGCSRRTDRASRPIRCGW